MVLPNLSGGPHIYPFATISCAGGSDSKARAAETVLSYSNFPNGQVVQIPDNFEEADRLARLRDSISWPQLGHTSFSRSSIHSVSRRHSSRRVARASFIRGRPAISSTEGLIEMF